MANRNNTNIPSFTLLLSTTVLLHSSNENQDIKQEHMRASQEGSTCVYIVLIQT